MPYPATVIEVLIASPGDVDAERKIARDVILRRNQIHCQKDRLILLPRMWETDAAPEMGSDAQDIINKQLVKGSDLLVAIFWTRLGSPTPRAPSGTVEEIMEHLNAGKPALIYFSRKAIAFDMRLDQREALQAFKDEIRPKGLVVEFNDESHFKDRFRDDLERTVHRFFSGAGLAAAERETAFEPTIPSLSDKALAILSGTAKSDNKQFMRMNMVTGPRIWSEGTVFHQEGDAKAAIGWTSAIQELVTAGLCRDLNGKGQIFELAQDGLDFLERGLRDRFTNGSDVYVETTIRKSSQGQEPQPDLLLKYIVRIPRPLVEGEGIEWNYDYILRDENFRYQVLTKVSAIGAKEMLDNWGRPGFSYRIEDLEFYEGDPKSLPNSYIQMGGGCLIWKNPAN